jgi:cytochrome c-type biogenesis protein
VSGFQDAVLSGSMLVAIPIALLAGLVSFFSPCVVPLLPGYFSYTTGLSAADLGSHRRGRMLLGSVLFVLGFSAVFVAGGVLFGAVGEWLLVWRRPIQIVLGVVTIVVGLAFLGLVPFLQREFRVHALPAVGLGAAPLLGFMFGLGWTPCLGPTLTAVWSLAAQEASAVRGAVLSFAFCLGLGLPFVAAALAWHRMLGAVAWVRKHQLWVLRLGGGLLVAVGLLLVTGTWDLLVAWLRAFFPDITVAI